MRLHHLKRILVVLTLLHCVVTAGDKTRLFASDLPRGAKAGAGKEVARRTHVTLQGEQFLINGKLTYEGRIWQGHRIEGLLMNARLVQGVFDDLNPETAHLWTYPDGPWNPDRNTDEFVAAMPEWRRHGLLCAVVNMQGGSPTGYGNRGWHNSAINGDGSLRSDYMSRLGRILDRADELGMVIMVGIFYFGQDQRLVDEAAVKRAVINTVDWIAERGYRNVLLEIANEHNSNSYVHDIIRVRPEELIVLARRHAAQRGLSLPVSISLTGGRIPSQAVVDASDYILLHGNGVKDPQRMVGMIDEVRAMAGTTRKPVVNNEDDRNWTRRNLATGEAPQGWSPEGITNNFVACVRNYASWGYFDWRQDGEGYDEGYQSVPVNWQISSKRKRAFFNLLAEITGHDPAAPRPLVNQHPGSPSPASSGLARESPPLKWGSGLLTQKPAWYASDEARAAADNVLRYQSPEGGWPKNTDLLAPATDHALAQLQRDGKANTIDNGATTLPIRFLAVVAHSTGEANYVDAVMRGVDYVLASQYSSGGFPQFYPLRTGYYSRITYNDGAMIGALELLREIAAARAPFSFIDAGRRARAADAGARGIDCILKSQIRQNGRLTAWCAQHDENTLEPAWGRAYEPPSLSGGESVGVVRFLMSIEKPSSEIVAAVEGAVAWFRSVPISGKRLDAIKRADGRTERILVSDPAAPPLWARFYELGTNRPLYMDRDSKSNYDFMKVSYERRSGYGYHSTAPAALIEKDYAAWRANLDPTRIVPAPISTAPVRLSEVQWAGVGCYKIEMPIGTVYFEKDNGVSGFKSFIDNEGNDWIASYMPPGPNGDFRGFPNSVGNFGHAGRDSGSTTRIVDGRSEGDVVVLETTNGTFTFQYWFFADRVAIKVVKSQGDYHFLLETVAGGTADADDYFVLADGKKRIPSGEFFDITPEWFIIGDPKVKNMMFFAKTPEDNAPNENHRQIRPNGMHNMDLYSFGRTGGDTNPRYQTFGMSGNEHVCLIGFTPADRPHAEIAQMIEYFLSDPFATGHGATAGRAR